MGGLALGPLGLENPHTVSYIHTRRGVFLCVCVCAAERYRREELKYMLYSIV